MKFNDAWDKAWDKTPKACRPTMEDFVKKNPVGISKIFAMMWSILSEAQKDGKIVLDDFVYIGNNIVQSQELLNGVEEEQNKELEPKNDEKIELQKSTVKTTTKKAAKSKKDKQPKKIEENTVDAIKPERTVSPEEQTD